MEKLIRPKKLFQFSLILFIFLQIGEISAQNCSANAGILNEVICANDQLTLRGNMPSPLQPVPSPLPPGVLPNPIWTQLSGPTVVIEDPSSPVTDVFGYTAGKEMV